MARARVTGLFFASLLAAAALLAGPVPVRAADPFEINVILSLTGPGSFLGKNEQSAFELIEHLGRDQQIRRRAAEITPRVATGGRAGSASSAARTPRCCPRSARRPIDGACAPRLRRSRS